jgi:hypothetical protein
MWVLEKWELGQTCAQETPRGGQAIRDLRCPLTVVSLKAGELEF